MKYADSTMRPVLAWLGGSLLEVLSELGGVAQLSCAFVRRLFWRRFELEAFLGELRRIGYDSTSVVGLLGLFTGMVMVVQTGETMKRWGTEAYVSEGVALVLLRELGPVLAGFLVAGRVGSGIAAELGSMAVSEQIDAMKSLGADPVKKLVVPKVVAGMVCLPMLTALADLIGILGGMVMAMTMLNVPPVFYFSRIQEEVVIGDFMSGFIKSVAFGGIIAMVACYYGLRTTGGTVGVGRSATQSVVMSCILILAADLIMTSVLVAISGSGAV
jgi:phospholipid/cholesterol/gamma-HCH transport system permease protein